MDSEGDDVLSNPGDAPEEDKTQAPTHDQDQEGDRERKKTKADDDGNVDLLLMQVQALREEQQKLLVLLLHFYKGCTALLRSEEDNHSLRAKVQGLMEKVKSTEAREEELQQAVKALEVSNTRLEMELAGFRSQIDRHLERRWRWRLKVSWAVAIIVASAVAVADLPKVKHRESGEREL
ncbi:hypothetical protein COCNU_14G005620 [Cocos nucifera]|uniref:Uncharacterized protein n=1 Tax=Cocos nucifera TaxID=13894 RepID=A0A8K0NC37_COCNU|nr:hypothetical protein COCNU_14G005620 [Cocos nucifera]